jgi:hypothetical protein
MKRIVLFSLLLAISTLAGARVAKSVHAYCDGGSERTCRLEQGGVTLYGYGNPHIEIQE